MFQWLSGLWRRDISRLALWEVLRRRGLRRYANHDPRALATAVERCSRCGESVACSRALAAGQDAKLAGVCPNVMYLAHLEAMARHAPKRDLL